MVGWLVRIQVDIIIIVENMLQPKGTFFGRQSGKSRQLGDEEEECAGECGAVVVVAHARRSCCCWISGRPGRPASEEGMSELSFKVNQILYVLVPRVCIGTAEDEESVGQKFAS